MMASPNFLGLPRELRDVIYRFATKRINLSPTGDEQLHLAVIVDHGPIPQMLAVNKEIRDEYMDAISSKMVLVFYTPATPMFRLDLPKVMRKDIPSTFLKSITQCGLSLSMNEYMCAWLSAAEEQEAREGFSGHEIPFDTFLCPMLQIMLDTLETVVSPSAKVCIFLNALDQQDCCVSEPPLVQERVRLYQKAHVMILQMFKTTILKQFIQEGHGDWPRREKLSIDFSILTSLYSTLDSDVMRVSSAADDVEPGWMKLSGPMVLWRLVPTETTTEGDYHGFMPEMIRILDSNNNESS